MKGFVFLITRITSHFSGLNSTDQFASHCSSLYKSFWSVSGSELEFIVKYTIVSSENSLVLLLRESNGSFMYARNKQGPKTVLGGQLTELVRLQLVCLRQLQTGFGIGGKILSKKFFRLTHKLKGL